MKRVDKGFEVNYYKLTYRRKFIRTLWLFPVVLMALKTYINCFDFMKSSNSIIIYLFSYGISVVVLVFYMWQLIYTYRKFKVHEKKEQK